MGGEYTPEQEDAMLQEAIRRGLDFETARDMIMSGKGRDLIPVRHLHPRSFLFWLSSGSALTVIYMPRLCVQQKGKVFGVEAEIEAMHAQSENEEEMAVPLFSFHVHCYL